MRSLIDVSSVLISKDEGRSACFLPRVVQSLGFQQVQSPGETHVSHLSGAVGVGVALQDQPLHGPERPWESLPAVGSLLPTEVWESDVSPAWGRCGAAAPGAGGPAPARSPLH